MRQTVPARADIDPFCQHGGRVDVARACFGGDDWIDLSTGISPYRYPVATAAVRGALHALPSPDAVRDLEVAAAVAFGGVDPGRVVAVPGSDIALRLIADLLPAGNVAVVGPGYGGHVTMWQRPVERVPATSLDAVTATHGCVVLANPNNPDGHHFKRAALVAAASALAVRGGWLVVDEAFADVLPDESLAAAALENVVVVRSFGKFFGLAGVRLGFVIAPPGIVSALRDRLGDWPVSGPAIVAGTAGYRDLNWQARQRARLARAAARLDRLLDRDGRRVIGGTALFRLVATQDASVLFAHLAKAHILVRPFADAPHRLRIGLPGHASHWRRLAAALSQGGPPS